jgi:hypothetical protein
LVNRSGSAPPNQSLREQETGHAMKPFRFFQSFVIPVNVQGQVVEFTLPANELLRIEFIAGDVTLPAGQSSFVAVSIQIHDMTGAITGLYSVSSHKLGNIGFWISLSLDNW